MNESNICLADCVQLHTIFQDKRYFLYLTLTNVNVSTISGTANLIEGSKRINVMLQNGTRFHINNSSKSTRNFLNFKDIHKNRYHIKSMNEGNIKCFYITSIVSCKKLVEKLTTFFSGLYQTNIKSIESYVVVNQKFNDPKIFIF